jgi:uncharacterized glyoxalase superfamily protein PhnB
MNMAGEAHTRDARAPLGATRNGTQAPRDAFARGPLRAARLRCRKGLHRIGQGDALARVIPTVRYRDVPAAVAWLCKAFGLRKHRLVAGENGAPCYAELRLGGSIVMIAPIEDTAFGRLMVQPDELGGVETQVCYLYVDNVAAHYARAKAAGAVVVIDPDDQANEGRGYSCRDPEGHVWNVGSYDPWQNRRAEARGRPPRRERHALAALLLVSVAAVLTADMPPPTPTARVGAALAETRAEEPAAEAQRRREAAERAAHEQREREVQAESAARATAEKAAAEARAQLVESHGAREKAEREAAAVRAQLEGALSAKAAAERAARQARVLLATADRDVREARAQAALEQKKRIAAEGTRKRVRAFRIIRSRTSVWCYNPGTPNPGADHGAQLSGFCKG